MFNRVIFALALLAALPAAAAAQAGHKHDAPKATGKSAANDTAGAGERAASAVDAAMSGHMTANLHMKMSPHRAASRADSARAARVVSEAQQSLGKYRDVKRAESDGYKLFAPEMKNQPVYHYTHWGHAVRNVFSFDAKRPTSLLYSKGANDSMELIGVMYTASKRASDSDLDKRIPLSIAQWHLHVNLCTPERGEQHRWTELENGKPRFGPLSEIATEKECKAVQGKFRPVLFNWMVHANVFSNSVWGEGHKH